MASCSSSDSISPTTNACTIGSAARSRREVRGHLRADPAYQRPSARFIENHDEPRSVVAFGARAGAAAVVMSTVPGLRFFYDGQFEGRRVHAPVQLGAARDKSTDPLVSARYRRLLAIVDAPVFHAGDWRLCDIPAAAQQAIWSPGAGAMVGNGVWSS